MMLRDAAGSLALAGVLSLACGSGPEVAGTDAGVDAGPAPWELEDLDDDEGFSLRVPPFEVPPSEDSQNCYFVRVPDLAAGQDVWIDRVLTALNPGSHHMNVFRVRTLVELAPEDGEPVLLGDYEATVVEGGNDYLTNPCWDSGNWADWPLVANSQHSDILDPFTDWQLPDGVAIRLQPGEMLMVQTHYVNTTDQPTPFGARVGVNFYRYRDSAPPVELGTLFATQQEIRICQSRPQVEYSGTCRFPTPVTITAANGHFHSRGDRFAISVWDGLTADHPPLSSQFYESDEWDHPTMATSLGVSADAGIWWDCSYQWQAPVELTCADVDAKDPLQEADCCYSFGGNVDVGEHCNVFLYYYPRLDSDVFCN